MKIIYLMLARKIQHEKSTVPGTGNLAVKTADQRLKSHQKVKIFVKLPYEDKQRF